jgi:hypothetical protein
LAAFGSNVVASVRGQLERSLASVVGFLEGG